MLSILCVRNFPNRTRSWCQMDFTARSQFSDLQVDRRGWYAQEDRSTVESTAFHFSHLSSRDISSYWVYEELSKIIHMKDYM